MRLSLLKPFAKRKCAYTAGPASQFKLLSIRHGGANNLPAQIASLLDGAKPISRATSSATSNTKNTPQSSQSRRTAYLDSYQNSSNSTNSSHFSLCDTDNAASDAAALRHLERGTYRNCFTAVRAVVPVVPLATAFKTAAASRVLAPND